MRTEPTQLQTAKPVDPYVVKEAWHEAMEAKKIADLRWASAKEAVEEAQQKIRHATQNEILIGAARDTLADLAQDQAARMVLLEEAEAHKKLAGKEMAIAWKAWGPFAAQTARSKAPPRIPRVSVLMEQNRRVREGTSLATKTNDPTYPTGVDLRRTPDGSPVTLRVKIGGQDKVGTTTQVVPDPPRAKVFKPGEDRAAYYNEARKAKTTAALIEGIAHGTDDDPKASVAEVNRRVKQAKRDRGLDLTEGVTGTAVPNLSRKDAARAKRETRKAKAAK